MRIVVIDRSASVVAILGDLARDFCDLGSRPVYAGDPDICDFCPECSYSCQLTTFLSCCL
jgi:hypothetical protein